MLQNTRFVFFGTPEFAAIVLDKLISAGFVPEAVVCNPDRPAGRRQVITPPAVKQRIMNYELGNRNEIRVLQPEKLDEKFHNSLFMLHNSFDLFIVAAYGKILPKEIIGIPRLGTIGVHSSLLPKYRGTSPIHGAILAGEKETGATLFMMDEKMDHGPIITQRKIPIAPIDTHETLYPKIWGAGGEALVEIIPDFLEGKIKPQVQDEAGATYTKKFTSADGFVEPNDLNAALNGDLQKAILIDRKIRAFGVEPGVWTTRPFGAAQDRPFGAAQDRPFGAAQDRPFGAASLEKTRDKPLDTAQGRQQRVKLLKADIENGRLVLKTTQVEGQRPINT